jgi:hypothetical protein
MLGVILQHWYSYHSEKTMGYPYAAVGRSGMYSTKTLSKLCNGDVIWVIEGPTKFALVDCFMYSDTEYPPFASGYSKFKIRVLGNHSLLRGSSYSLNLADKWFAELHSRFITKQNFFNLLTTEPEIIEGLCHVSGIKF